MKAKGQDWVIRVMRDGAVQTEFRVVQSATINFGLELDTYRPVGATRDEVRGQNGNPSVSLPIRPKSDAYIALFEAQRIKNLPNADPDRQDISIDITCSIDFGSGGRSRVMLPDCTLHDGSVTASGRLDDTTGDTTFTSSEWRKI